jgi:hypothetical protein
VTGRRTAIAACAAPGHPHPATHRDRCCDVHHDEYQAAVGRYRSRRSQARNGIGNDPGPRDDYVAVIQFSDLGKVGRMSTINEQAEIAEAAANLTTITSRFGAYAASPEDWHGWSVKDVRRLYNEVLTEQLAVPALLRRFTDDADRVTALDTALVDLANAHDRGNSTTRLVMDWDYLLLTVRRTWALACERTTSPSPRASERD